MTTIRARVRAGYFWTLKNTLNRLTGRLAKAGVGPLALVRHTGRRSGRTFETPLILARVPEGFIAELTYGPTVNWYRNVIAAGGCTIVIGKDEYQVTAVEPYPSDAGRSAFGNPAALVLRLLRRHEFRLLRTGRPLQA
jgi:deazaflavin-dependent oxidoreductase (nitroreductase family)